MTDESGLEKLLAEVSEINKNLLGEVLAPYVKIGKETGLPIFTPEYARLSNSGKIIVYLLARKAASILRLLNVPEPVTPKEISKATGVAYDSVKPTLSSLARSRIVTREGGQYSFPNHLLLQARELVK